MNCRITTVYFQVSLSGITRVSAQAVLLFGKDWTFDTVSSTGEHIDVNTFIIRASVFDATI
jgi:hypothetical protein